MKPGDHCEVHSIAGKLIGDFYPDTDYNYLITGWFHALGSSKPDRAECYKDGGNIYYVDGRLGTLPFGIASIPYSSKDLPLATQESQEESKCDCGGFKTYGTMEPEFHSGWCKSRSGT